MVILQYLNEAKNYASEWADNERRGCCNGLVQERCNTIANALELRLSYTNSSI